MSSRPVIPDRNRRLDLCPSGLVIVTEIFLLSLIVCVVSAALLGKNVRRNLDSVVSAGRCFGTERDGRARDVFGNQCFWLPAIKNTKAARVGGLRLSWCDSLLVLALPVDEVAERGGRGG